MSLMRHDVIGPLITDATPRSTTAACAMPTDLPVVSRQGLCLPSICKRRRALGIDVPCVLPVADEGIAKSRRTNNT